MQVLAIGAHPDDLEFQCAGTLARYTREGHSVVMCHVTDGDFGGHCDRGKIARTRRAEAEAAARAIGAEHAHLGVPEGALSPYDAAQLRGITELVRDVRPDLVMTHFPRDYHDDHNIVSALTLDATFKATIPLYDARGAYLRKPPPVLFIDTMRGVGFDPQEWVDISHVFELKLEAVRCHESQLRYMREHYEMDPLEHVEITARYRGLQAGVALAEGFVPSYRWHRISTRRLLP
jgi:LmbE family N-acetylglucosaminyl deacetylase